MSSAKGRAELRASFPRWGDGRTETRKSPEGMDISKNRMKKQKRVSKHQILVTTALGRVRATYCSDTSQTGVLVDLPSSAGRWASTQMGAVADTGPPPGTASPPGAPALLSCR